MEKKKSDDQVMMTTYPLADILAQWNSPPENVVDYQRTRREGKSFNTPPLRNEIRNKLAFLKEGV